MKVVVLEDAKADIHDASRFYESCREGIGSYFLDSILSDLDSLELFAGIHPVWFGYHRALSKRFPYAIYYLVEADTACVYAVLDLRSDPARLKTMLGDRSP